MKSLTRETYTFEKQTWSGNIQERHIPDRGFKYSLMIKVDDFKLRKWKWELRKWAQLGTIMYGRKQEQQQMKGSCCVGHDSGSKWRR